MHRNRRRQQQQDRTFTMQRAFALTSALIFSIVATACAFDADPASSFDDGGAETQTQTQTQTQASALLRKVSASTGGSSDTDGVDDLAGDGREPVALKCKNVSGRWQICGSASRKKLVVGVGLHFMEYDPSGNLVSASDDHSSCESALADRSVPSTVRAKASALCGSVYAQTFAAFAYPIPLLVDSRGGVIAYNAIDGDLRQVADQAVDDLIASDPGVAEIGCSVGPGISISCWGGGHMCAAWVEDGEVDGQCWECTLADCD
jgi:hypothetical protein